VALILGGQCCCEARSSQLSSDQLSSPDFLEAYAYSHSGASSCPEGYRIIGDINGCTAALEALGGQDCVGIQGGHHGAAAWAGCAQDQHSGCVHFNMDNTRTPVQLESSFRYLCARSPSLKRHLHLKPRPARAPEHLPDTQALGLPGAYIGTLPVLQGKSSALGLTDANSEDDPAMIYQMLQVNGTEQPSHLLPRDWRVVVFAIGGPLVVVALVFCKTGRPLRPVGYWTVVESKAFGGDVFHQAREQILL